MAPWSPLWRGQDLVNKLLDTLDSPTREAVERDLALIGENPGSPTLPFYEWKGEDHLPWPSRVAIVAERFAVRYVAWRAEPYFAVISIVDLTVGLGDE